jgi:hypothetical protein
MNDTGNLIAISDAQASAIQEGLKTLQGFGGFLEKTFGTIPQDLVGIFGGDWLKAYRLHNINRLTEKFKARVEERGVKPERISPSVWLPILRAAVDESRDELQDIWAALLAAAADPARARWVRVELTETVKQLEPLDALILKTITTSPRPNLGSEMAAGLVEVLNVERDDVFVSLEHLHQLGCLEDSPRRLPNPNVSAKARLLMRAVRD